MAKRRRGPKSRPSKRKPPIQPPYYIAKKQPFHDWGRQRARHDALPRKIPKGYALARRWWRASTFSPETKPSAIVYEAERLIRQLFKAHKELKKKPGLWGARLHYFEEVDADEKGNPIFDHSEKPHTSNVPLSTSYGVLEELHARMTVNVGMGGGGATKSKRWQVFRILVYVYPDSTPRGTNDYRIDASKKLPHQSERQKRDNRGRFRKGRSDF